MIIKYAISSVDPLELAEEGQASGFSGSITKGYGFGDWGVEPTTFLEVALPDTNTLPEQRKELDKFVRTVLFKHSQEAAYRTVNGVEGGLLHVTGRFELI